jgi:hypothetical protein
VAAFKQFILNLQLGGRYVDSLNKHDRVAKFFNVSSMVAQVLLYSKRSLLPPAFKQACYKHRKGLHCGYVGPLHQPMKEVEWQLEALGNSHIDEAQLPILFDIDRTKTSSPRKVHRKA